jgi:flagella basal body P-ring formation protein FlgA
MKISLFINTAVTMTAALLFALCHPAQAASTPESLLSELTNWVAAQNQTSADHIKVTPPDARVKLQPCSGNLSFDYPFANHESVRVRCAQPNWQLFIKVALAKSVNSVVTSHAMSSGQILTDADIELRPDFSPAVGSLTERSSVTGRALKRAMGKGQVILASDLDSTLSAIKFKVALRADDIVTEAAVERVTLQRNTAPASVWLGSELPPGLRLARDVQAGQVLQIADLAEIRQVVVAATDLLTGQALKPGLIRLDKLGQDKVTRSHYFELNKLDGMELVRPIRTGEPIRSADVRPALLVKKGELVLFSVGRATEFQVSVKLEALQDGRLGDQIKLRNNESGRTLSGMVSGPGAVRGM